MEKAEIIDGRAQAEKIFDNLTEKISSEKLNPFLQIVYVGSDDASRSYIGQKREKAARIGIKTGVQSFPADVDQNIVFARIHELNNTPEVDGIIIQLPLPEKFETQELINGVQPEKDVDGLHPVNFGRLLSGCEPLYYPPTPAGIMNLLDAYEVSIEGEVAVLVGMGRLVGRPLSQMFLNREATVLCLHEKTTAPCSLISQGDIVVSGAGVAGLIGPEEVRAGAVVVDAGFNNERGKLVGDVEFEGVKQVAGKITPVPGGVGPMTVAGLLANTVQAACSDE